MATNNRTCLCCETKFTFCPNCGKNNGYNINFDTQECAELYNAISCYNMGVSGKDKVKSIVDKFNITDYSKYKTSIAKFLRTEIFNSSYETPIAESITEKIVEESQVTIEENEPEVQTKSHKRRFSSKNKSYQKKEVELSDETGENEVETMGISKEE